MRAVRRLIWFIALTAAASLLAALGLALATRPLPASGIQYLLTVPIPFLAAGIFLLWRHPGSRVARLLVAGTALTMAYAALLERIIKDRYAASGPETWMSWALSAEAPLMMVGLGCIAVLLALFPTGVPSTRSEKIFAKVAWALPIAMVIAQAANENVLVEPVAYGGLDSFQSPIHVGFLAWLGPATRSMRSSLGVIVLVAVVFLFLRYRREKTEERRLIRWVAFGSLAAVGIGIVPFIISPVLSPDSPLHGQLLASLGSLALLLIPASIVVAIDQPEWLDPDTFISKSFAYGALSIGIFVIYGAIAAGLGLAAGARLPLEVAIVVTAVLAFAFQPARTRLQRIADRWVFGDRPTPIEAVAGLDRSAPNPDTGEFNERLAETVRRAARVRWATVRLPPAPPFTAGTHAGDTAYIAEIRHGADRFGDIRCGPRINGQLKDDDIDLIEALAVQSGLVVANARLAGRIVHAQEAERRRLERNIHDGAQQELVALVAKLGLARARARNEALDEADLIELQRDAGNILKDLRDLAQGIHPSVLTDGGLVEAVEDKCSRLPIKVVVDATPGLRSHRFDDDVEGAAYFFVTEGLTNVLKHANATEARVDLTRKNGDLRLIVADDGWGFDSAATEWNGLAGLADRFAALSGNVTVDTGSGRGTVLEGRIPIETDA